ncbi:hypothetical protein [Immundisolibacter sp.]|uniref:hypothetical protein n=1 Tax=Immundisolibacter sp. TaxID=1934948 RepID=UPI003569589D
MGTLERFQIDGSHRKYSEADVRRGARNMLVDGCDMKAGDEVLILNENGITEPALSDVIEDEARKLGGRVHVMWTDTVTGPDDMPPSVVKAFESPDVTIFNHMIAGVLRMVPFNGRGMKMLNFLQTWDQLGSPFGQVPYKVWLEVLKNLGPRLGSAKSWRITCPLGSDLSGLIPQPGHSPKQSKADAKATGDGFTLRTFPLGVCQVFDSMQASGRLAVRWLTPSGVHVFEPNGIALGSPVMIEIDRGRITGFDGDPQAVAQLRAYMEKCGREMAKEPYIVNSWHAGINPRCLVTAGPDQGLDQWMYMVHANPRIVHFHTIGPVQPGEMSIPVVDPTIEFDGEKVWDAGRLVFLDRPDVQDKVRAFGDPQFAFHHELEIGV